jgi:hypothetical protein
VPNPTKGVRSRLSHTFNWWFVEKPGEVKMIDVDELKGFESTYMRCFNYIKCRGWYREKGNWCSPDGKYRFNKIEAAFRCCKFYEEIVKPT